LKYPYFHEQVGKNNLPIPSSTLSQPALLQTTLRQGDILYIPRGYVHEACTTESHPSFHATIALPTHDWSLCSTVPSFISQCLQENVKFRMAFLPPENDESLNEDLEEIISLIREKMTVQTLHASVCKKSSIHFENRSACLLRFSQKKQDDNNKHEVVGPTVSSIISMTTRIRAATEEERSQLLSMQESGLGQNIRRGVSINNDDVCDYLLSILGEIKENRGQNFHVSSFCSNEKCDDLSLLCFIQCCVEFGSLAIVL